MDAAAANYGNPGASDLLIEHCFALDAMPLHEVERQSPTAVDRLEALLGAELSRRLLQALSGDR